MEKGISLIPIIITIIVIVILVGGIIFSFNNNDIIKNENIVISEQDRTNLIDAYKLIVNENLFEESLKEEVSRKMMIERLAKKTGITSKYLKDFIIDENGNLCENGKIIVNIPLKQEENLGEAVNIKDMISRDEKDLTKIQVGDFINYDAGNWTQEDIDKITAANSSLIRATYSKDIPNQSFQFGGFKINDSRNENAVSDLTYNGLKDNNDKIVAGWRVFDMNKETGDITLISAGCPEAYYCGEYAGKNSENLLKNRDYSMYVNSKAKSAEVLSKARLEEWYNKYIKTTNANIEDEITFKKINNTKYNNIINKNIYYWLNTLYESEISLYMISALNNNVSQSSDIFYGISMLISLKNDIQIYGKASNKIIIKDPKDSSKTTEHNVWNIVK